METLLRELRLALRCLRRDWGFSLICVLILGIGIGANTAVFSVVHAVLLRPLPFEQPDRLAWVSYKPLDASSGLSAIAPRVDVLEEWQKRSASFEVLTSYDAFFSYISYKLSGDDEPARLVGVPVARDLFDVLGVRPYLGRPFADQECQLGGPPAAILTYQLWQRRFQADPEIVGRVITLNETSVTVVGVMPEAFDFTSVFSPGTPVDLFVPLIYDVHRNWGNTLAVIGRLRPAVSAETAHVEMARVTQEIKRDRTEFERRNIDARVVTLAEEVNGSTRRALAVLLACVATVLLIACANISNLQLARAAARRKEFAIRTALGADRLRLVRQLLTEGLVLSSAGAVVGLVFAWAATASVARLQAVSLPLLYRVEIGAAALAVTVTASVVTGLVFGLVPAFQVSFSRMHDELKESVRGSSGGTWSAKARTTLVVAETALACTLLVGAGLLVRSFLHVLEVDLGFQPEQALTINVDTGGLEATLESRAARFNELIRAVEAVPGVAAASITDALPLERNRSWGIAAKTESEDVDQFHPTFVTIVGANHLKAMGIPLHSGRDVAMSDTGESAPVVVINEAAARQLFPGEGALERVVRIGREERTVIGVAADIRHKGVETAAGLQIYLPFAQTGAEAVELVIRTKGRQALTRDVRTALRSVDPTLPVTDLRPLSWLVDRAVSPRRFFMSLLVAFAVFALVLAALGIFGVISYSVSQRTAEIGIRMALGASGARVRRRVLRETLTLAALGIVIGALGALVLGRAMSSLLFGVAAADPQSFFFMLASSVLIALVAGLLPAVRAARVDPATALRSS